MNGSIVKLFPHVRGNFALRVPFWGEQSAGFVSSICPRQSHRCYSALLRTARTFYLPVQVEGRILYLWKFIVFMADLQEAIQHVFRLCAVMWPKVDVDENIKNFTQFYLFFVLCNMHPPPALAPRRRGVANNWLIFI